MENEPPKGFQVRDRRRFTESGEVRGDVEDSGASKEAPAAEPLRSEVPPADTAPQDVPLEITLSTFLISLSTQALMCLGEIPNPATGQTETDLTAVRELIDIIAMLQEKTRGNVDATEARLLEKILFDLRMRFVEKARK
jgi:hypothetical protein